MSATTITARSFGRCTHKGCKTRIVTNRPLEFRHNDIQLHMLRGYQGAPEKWWIDAMNSLGLLCPDHDAWRMYWTSLDATYNPVKECSARCTGATGPACDCSCGGENHGSRHAH